MWSAAPGLLSINLLVTLTSGLVPVAQLYVGKHVVDEAMAAASRGGTGLEPLWRWLSALAGLFLAQAVLSHLGSYVSQVLQDRFSLHANERLLTHAAKLDLAHFESPGFHDALKRAQEDGSRYPVMVLGSLTSLAGQVANLTGLLALLVRFDPLLTVLLAATSLPAFLVAVRFSGRRFWMVRRQTQSGRLADYFRRVLTEGAYVKEVRLFGLAPHLLGRWRAVRTKFNEESQALQRKHSSARLGVDVVANAGYFGAYGLVLLRAAKGLVTVGELTMYAGAFQQAQSSLMSLLLNVASVHESSLRVSQFFEFLALEPLVVDAPEPLPFPVPLREGLEFRSVTFTYPGAPSPTLRDVSFKVRPGECVALVGANGSGKTTLLKLLARFHDPDRGEVLVDGIPVRRIRLEGLRRSIGVIFQDFARYSLPAEANVAFGDVATLEGGAPRRVEEAARKAGAHDVIESLPAGYATVLGKTFDGGVDLSGGQWQKVGLARAFLAPAPILILDEPTAAVDALAEFDLYERFRELTRGKTTFLVSHRFSTVRLADRILVFEGGRLVEEGSHAELLARGGLYERMFTLQASSYLNAPPARGSARV